MAVLEMLDVVREYASPREAVQVVRLTLDQHFDELVEAGVRPFRHNGKIEVQGYVSATGGIALDGFEYDEAMKCHYAEGGVGGVTIRRDTNTGAIGYASMNGNLPAQLTEEKARGLFRADSWSTRLHFPAQHAHKEAQRLVVDSYQLPRTYLSLAAAALSATGSEERKDFYDELYANMWHRTDKAGVPIGAVAISHTIYGRGDYLPEASVIALNTVMSTFTKGVHDVVAWRHQLSAEIAAEHDQ